MTEVTIKQAACVKRYRPGGKLGDAALYFLSPPIACDIWRDGETYDYVLLSTRDGSTEVFPASASGRVEGWTDIGLVEGADYSTHESTLRALGYEITDLGGMRS